MDVVEPLLAPPGALAGGGTPRLPSSFCHNFSFFSLFLGVLKNRCTILA
jgi:hypothetical protein